MPRGEEAIDPRPRDAASSPPSGAGPRATSGGREPALLAPFPHPTGTVDDRARALLEWLTNELRPELSFVSDEDGLAVLTRGARLEHLAVTAGLVRALGEVQILTGENRGALSVRLDRGQVLSCVVDRTELGRLIVGWVRPERTAEVRLDAVGDALLTTFSSKENPE